MNARANAAPAPTTAPAPKSKPNVLVILIDDHPFNYSDVYQKDGLVHTPNMKRLANRGTWFSRGYNDAPICCASRTALLTGVHSTRSGVYYNNPAYRRAPNFISRVTTLPGQFLKNGYLTVGYGKMGHNSFVRDDIADYTPGYFKTLNHPEDVTWPEDKLLTQIIPGTLQEIPGQAATNWSWGVLPDDWDRDDPNPAGLPPRRPRRPAQSRALDRDQPRRGGGRGERLAGRPLRPPGEWLTGR